MAESNGEKTEKPTGKRLEEASRLGQFARTPEVNTVMALVAAVLGMKWFGSQVWSLLMGSMTDSLTHLGGGLPTELSIASQFIEWLLQLARISGSIVALALVAAAVSGLSQSRFRISTGALGVKWERLDPMEGIGRLFKPASFVRAITNLVKLTVILAVSATLIWRLFNDPVFLSNTGLGELLGFMADAMDSLLWRLILGILIVAGADYSYQIWNTQQEMMMTRQEVKEESKASEGDPHFKGELKKRRMQSRKSWRMTIPTADVVITNPTHLAIALKYDFKSGSAPVVVAKGSGTNALRIRELAREFQVPIIENKPVARILFQSCDEGQAVDPRLYQAVAEILAIVYRTNRYRYYVQGNRIPYGR